MNNEEYSIQEGLHVLTRNRYRVALESKAKRIPVSHKEILNDHMKNYEQFRKENHGYKFKGED